MRRSKLPFFIAIAFGLGACGENQTRPGHDPIKDSEPPNLTCIPNLDGRIDENELQAALGVPASYLVSPAGEKREVDLVGTSDDKGSPIWDFSQDFASDLQATLVAAKVSEKWYKDSFPEGEFAAPADAAGTLDAVYKHTGEALYLLGLASMTEKPKQGKTLLVYDAPIALYKFPIEPGKSWTESGTIQGGVAYGLPYAGKDTYQVEVDVTGTLELFDYEFTQVHRIKLHVIQERAVGASSSTRQSQFLFECFGEVARATSLPEEAKDNFTMAAEVRRLGQ